jgi:hypothetical protein
VPIAGDSKGSLGHSEYVTEDQEERFVRREVRSFSLAVTAGDGDVELVCAA